MGPILCLVLAAHAVAGVHVIAPVIKADYIAPHATSYVYRSDNNGPASIIQVGLPYQQPHAFAPSLLAPQPLAHQPIINVEQRPLYDYQPNIAPLPYLAAQPVIVQDSDDLYDDDDDDYLHHDGHAYEAGAGSDYGEEHHSAHGDKGNTAYSKQGNHASGSSKQYEDGHDEGYYAEKGGEAAHGHDESGDHAAHHASGSSYEGGDQGHKQHFSEGEDVEGYHKVFNKNEYKKDHDFYDVADNSGHFNKHGYETSNHGNEEAANKHGAHQEAGYDKGDGGRAGFHVKENHDESDVGHSAEEGQDSYYTEEKEYGKKGGANQGKDFVYGVEDDDEYDY